MIRQQAITWTNDDPIYLAIIMACILSPSFNKQKSS